MPQLIPDYPGPKPRWILLRSFLPYLLLVLGIAFGLSSFSLLSHFRGPAEKQQIGWQAWDTIDVASQGGAADNVPVGGGNETGPGGGDEAYIPSIPLDNWVSTGERGGKGTDQAGSVCITHDR